MGADVNKRTTHGESALHFATFLGLRRVVHLLLNPPPPSQPVDVNAAMDDGTTPRFIAVQEGYDTIDRVLEQRGAIVLPVSAHGGCNRRRRTGFVRRGAPHEGTGGRGAFPPSVQDESGV